MVSVLCFRCMFYYVYAMYFDVDGKEAKQYNRTEWCTNEIIIETLWIFNLPLDPLRKGKNQSFH